MKREVSIGKEFPRVLEQKKTSEVTLGKSHQKLNVGKLSNNDFVSPVFSETTKGQTLEDNRPIIS